MNKDIKIVVVFYTLILMFRKYFLQGLLFLKNKILLLHSYVLGLLLSQEIVHSKCVNLHISVTNIQF